MKTPKPTGDPKIDTAMRDSLRDLPRLLNCGRVDVITAGEPFVVTHKLNRVPDFFIADKWNEMEVTATEAMRQQWTDKQIVLVSSVAGTCTLFVGGF